MMDHKKKEKLEAKLRELIKESNVDKNVAVEAVKTVSDSLNHVLKTRYY